MAGIQWAFGRHGVSVTVTNVDGEMSNFSSDQAVTEFTIAVDPVGESTRAPELIAAQQQVLQLSAGEIVLTIVPIQVRTSISFADEGMVDLTYVVEKDQITGKGRGKGIGKRTEM